MFPAFCHCSRIGACGLWRSSLSVQLMPTNQIIRLLTGPIYDMRRSCVIAGDGFAYRALLKLTSLSAPLSS